MYNRLTIDSRKNLLLIREKHECMYNIFMSNRKGDRNEEGIRC